ncbi:hypothetical protein SASPL_136633 [Salvia splendens]|uniref:Uncharacterized protein n=1 Tax=Salvia splendens TaxID=180675 RepID=A0A8X8ZGS8_SALSN|nr:hypothetical protein SASPL_136633 [Salvia splendens]
MATRRHCILLAFVMLFISLEVSSILAQNSGNGNGGGKNGNANGNGNDGGNNGNADGNGNAGGRNRNAGGRNGNADGNGNGGGKNGNVRRRPKCNGYGSLCYDPRFVGGDGVMFYFHGYAIVSDENLHINAHLIGTRPQGRTRDYTWVQALSVMFDSHTLVIAAKKLSHWSDNVDAILFKWNGTPISIPRDGEAEWRANTGERDVIVERTDDVNTVRVSVTGLVELDIRVVPIGKEENWVHNYQLPNGNAYAHLETQFKLLDLSEGVEEILWKMYRPGYVNPAKRGVGANADGRRRR